jgi:hypothetical protein
MNISILGNNSQSITLGCNFAYIMNNENALAMTFDTDEVARSNEELLKKMNLKTKHNDCEITVLNISDYNLQFK